MLLFIALCLHGLARGQTSDYTSFYWFDNQQGKPTVLPTVDGTFDIDASALSDGLHAFHYIVAMKEGGLSAPFTSYFLKASQDEEPIKGFYWFDSQQGKPTVLPTVQGLFDLDVSSLSEGLHSFHYAAMKEDGGISTPYTGYFLKTPFGDATIKGLYWFDNEPTAYEAPNLNGLFNVDVSSLSDGFHQFSFIASQSGSGLANPSTCYFLKIAQVAENDSLTCLCSVDRQLRHIEKLPQQGGVIHWDLDMQDISDGIHHIQLQAVTKSGALSNSYSTYFMRLTSMEELSEMRCVYAIDGSSMNSNSNVVGHDGCYHFDLDLSDLEEGLHYISFLLHNERGTSTKVQTRFFLKTPLGGNGITQYQYWLNDESIEQAKTVTLPEKVNPLQLMSLLPVESRLLRSLQFHFDTSSGKPMVYAKNTIHLRFYDSAMRFSDAAKDYVDYSVGQEVNVIKTLESGVRESTSKPEENQIKWYSVTAERGDSLSFKTDIAATLQLFSPSGQEVYSASGYEVMQWNGCHAEENGTYYLALHDVTATEGEAICIDYEHIDRYAVLRQDVDVVGNGGYSTITFEGNGYDELTSVDLVFGDEVISSIEIGHEGNAITSVKFDFSDAQLGEYKAVFHFTEGELTIEKCVTVEEAVDIEIATTVSYAAQFLRGTSSTLTFKIRNEGNMTAYNVPMAIRIFTPDSLCLSGIKIEGFSIKDYLNQLSDGEIHTGNSLEDNMQYFIKFEDIDYIQTKPYMYLAYICPTLRPNTTETISLIIDADNQFGAYIWIPKYWDTGIQITNASKVRKKLLPRKCIENFMGCLNYYNQYLNGKMSEQALRDHGCVKSDSECDETIPPNGGDPTPIPPGDPNDIYGYLSGAGSKFIPDSVAEVNYTIEFENDPEIATAAAHTIVIKDTLDSRYFDLTKFMPTGVRIGGHEMFLNEVDIATSNDKTTFVKTIDMRPEINAIAQVNGEYNQKNGIAQWTFQSLDPMTMEPTDDLMQGILPVNYDGTSGIGEVMFEVGVKPNKGDGTQIPNRAGIVFDYEEAIQTPTWTNIVDAVPPTSSVEYTSTEKADTATLHFTGEDARSGVWRYTVYVQDGKNAPWREVGVTDSCAFDFKYAEGIDYGFCILATDSAGNIEQKELAREARLRTFIEGDANGDGVVDTKDAVLVISYYLGLPGTYLNMSAADIVEDGVIDTKDAVAIIERYLNTSTSPKAIKNRKRIRVL